MHTVEIDREVLEDMLATMRYLHTLVMRITSQTVTSPTSGKWLTTQAAANALRISPKTLTSMKTYGKIGFFKEYNSRCLFNENELLKFISDNKIDTKDKK